MPTELAHEPLRPPEEPERLTEGARISLTPTEKRKVEIVAQMLDMSISALFRKLTLDSSLFRYTVSKSIESNPMLRLSLGLENEPNGGF